AAADGCFLIPLAVRLPFVLPGTDLWLDGIGSVEVAAVSGGRLRLRRERETIEVPLDPALPQPCAELSIRRSPTVRYQGCEIVLQPHALAAPGIDFAAAAMSAGLSYQAEHADLFVRGLRVMERYAPRTFRRFRDAMRIIALKPLGADDFTNVSHSDFPGASVVSVVHHPFELADALIHEFHHNVLYALEERGAFFVDGRDGITDERHYSPWRPDPRPLRGVLHGIYVHLPVCAYWLTVNRSVDVDPVTARYALDRVLRLVAQLTLGVAVLDRQAAFSSQGLRLWRTLLDDFAALRERVAGAGLPDDAPALVCREDGTIEPERNGSGRALGVREVVLEHRRRYDPEARPDVADASRPGGGGRSPAGTGFPPAEGMEAELGTVVGGARAVVGHTQ
ncbi:MAG: aKG-HExxH-type peptide beta-hydroxylase, partial [Candidatus Binatia bacterium]